MHEQDGKGMMPLAQLTADIETIAMLRCGGQSVAVVTDDSRDVVPGSLFVAVDGVQVDGHSFVAQAVERGAVAVVCEKLPAPLPPCAVIQVPDSRIALSALAHRFHGSPSEKICLVGVTGTDGKSTTTELIRRIMLEAGFFAGSLGTVAYRLGTQQVESSQTTPHPLLLHRMLREMVQAGISHAAMEVTSQALAQHRTRHVNFGAAVLTNVTEDHLDAHGSLGKYILAKRLLFRQLDEEGTAVLNADSAVCDLYADATRANILTYGFKNLADVAGRIETTDLGGIELTVRTPLEDYRVQSPLTGDYNAENILAAVAAAFSLGIAPDAIRRAVRWFKGLPGRMEWISRPGHTDAPAVCVDYAHTPNALKRVLSALRQMVSGELICLFGCGGDREKQKRPEMGRIAAMLADLVVITSDNSRSERTEDIISDIVRGMPVGRDNYVVEPDRRLAIRTAIGSASGPASVVALCGRGSERHQLIGNRRIPFDDRSVAREIMAETGSATKRKSA